MTNILSPEARMLTGLMERYNVRMATAADFPRLQEIDFDHQRRGLGTRLIATACEAARAAGATTLGLTTYRDIPWNGPYYARLGFREVRGDDIPAPLKAMLAHEAADGHDPARRCAMVAPLASRLNSP